MKDFKGLDLDTEIATERGAVPGAEELQVELLQAQWELLGNYARIIALMPLEKWLDDFNTAEIIGPLVDPTMFRNYLSSGKGEVIKSIIEAALPLKRAILQAQTSPAMLRELETIRTRESTEPPSSRG